MGKSTEPPKCKICGSAHRGPCYTPMPRGAAPTIDQPKRKPKPPVTAFKDAMVETLKDPIDQPAVLNGDGTLSTISAHQSLRQAQRDESPGFDKRAYQREYMRKRRAAARAAKGASND